MKKLFLNIILLSGLLAINSCKKNALPLDTAPVTEPVFYVNCNVNSVPVSVKAGVDNFYMYSSYAQPTTGVYQYKADLKQSSCAGITCGYGLSFIINDFKVSLKDAPAIPDSGLYIGKYDFNDGSLPPLTYYGAFNPLVNSVYAPFTWTFNNGVAIQTATTSATSPTAYHIFKNNQTYSVSCKISNSLGTPTHTNVFKIGNPLQANVNVTKIDPLTSLNYSYSVNSTIPVNNYDWNFGDANTNTTNLSYTYHNYDVTGDGYYTTKLTLTNGTNVCESYYQVPAFLTNPTKAHANFSNYFSPIPNTYSLSAITVLVTDPNGNVSSSDAFSQTGTSNFEIVSVEDYKDNEQGQKTKKVTINFSCTVKSSSGTLDITNGKAVIAVAYHK